MGCLDCLTNVEASVETVQEVAHDLKVAIEKIDALIDILTRIEPAASK